MNFQKLKELYRAKGINLVYSRSKVYYLSIIGVPTVVEGIENTPGECQLTGYLKICCKQPLLDVDRVIIEVYDEYRKAYANNKTMLSYIEGQD